MSIAFESNYVTGEVLSCEDRYKHYRWLRNSTNDYVLCTLFDFNLFRKKEYELILLVK